MIDSSRAPPGPGRADAAGIVPARARSWDRPRRPAPTRGRTRAGTSPYADAFALLGQPPARAHRAAACNKSFATNRLHSITDPEGTSVALEIWPVEVSNKPDQRSDIPHLELGSAVGPLQLRDDQILRTAIPDGAETWVLDPTSAVHRRARPAVGSTQEQIKPRDHDPVTYQRRPCDSSRCRTSRSMVGMLAEVYRPLLCRAADHPAFGALSFGRVPKRRLIEPTTFRSQSRHETAARSSVDQSD